MVDDKQLVKSLSAVSGVDHSVVNNPDIAHLFIHRNKVVGLHLVPGLEMDFEELEDGIKVNINVKEGTVIEKPVQMCYGMIPRNGIQRIISNINIGDNSHIDVIAHCSFPNAVDIKHIMDAKIVVGKKAHYSYLERHIHGDKGGAKVYPKTVAELKEGAYFKTEFELLKGRVGLVDIDYETTCGKSSVLEMKSRINGKVSDIIKIKEAGNLIGDYARAVLSSKVAVRGNTKAEVYNKLTASGSYARGHVDCTEIIQDNGVVTAVPIVEVNNPKAHITHEASLGSVDSKQLQTLMSRGLSENEAVELIIQGLLS